MKKLRRRYQGAGPAYRRKLIGQEVEVLGYHRKSAIRALGSTEADRIRPANTGRPRRYEAGNLTPWLRPIWQATDYACGRRLEAMLPEWIPAYEAHEQSLPGEVRGMWGRGQAGTLEALQDVENRLPFPLLGLDSDNGGEFLNHHVLGWLQKRERPVFMTEDAVTK